MSIANATQSQPLRSTIVGLTGGKNFEQKDVQRDDLRGRVAVVTGATKGIGFEVTKSLAMAGCRVLLLSRKVDQGEDAVSQIKTVAAEDPVNTLDMDLEFKECDLGSLQDVKRVADEIARSEDRLDFLISDAGIGVNKFELSADGIDRHFSVNVLGHLLLINRLLPLVRKTSRIPDSPPPRIISVASSLHQRAPSDAEFKSIEEINNPNLSTDQYYARSKLAVILYIRFILAERAILPHFDKEPIYAIATHPGYVHTDQVDQYKEAYGPVVGRLFKAALVSIMRSPDAGSLSTLWAAVADEVVTDNLQGVYLQDPGNVGGDTAQSKNPLLGANLFNLVESIVREKLGDDGFLPWDEGTVGSDSLN